MAAVQKLLERDEVLSFLYDQLFPMPGTQGGGGSVSSSPAPGPAAPQRGSPPGGRRSDSPPPSAGSGGRPPAKGRGGGGFKGGASASHLNQGNRPLGVGLDNDIATFIGTR